MNFLLRETDVNLVSLSYDLENSYGVGPDAETFSVEHFRRMAIYHTKDVRTGADGKITPTDLAMGPVDLKAAMAPILDSNRGA